MNKMQLVVLQQLCCIYVKIYACTSYELVLWYDIGVGLNWSQSANALQIKNIH